jgi:hypothetical protein
MNKNMIYPIHIIFILFTLFFATSTIGDATYGQQHVQDIQAKKAKVGDIDIAYKKFGKGKPILLISGSGNVMGVWP